MNILPYIPSFLSLFKFAREEIFPVNLAGGAVSDLARHTLARSLPPGEKVNLVVGKSENLGMQVLPELFGPTILVYDPFLEVDPDAFSFVMKHEIGHILEFDGPTHKITEIATKFLLAALLNHFIGPIPASIFTSIDWIIGLENEKKREFNKRSIDECKADIYAINASNVEEIKGGLRHFKAVQCVYQTLWKCDSEIRDQCDENGDALIEIGDEHPPLSKRIALLQSTLLQMGESIDLDMEKTNILIKKIWERLLELA